MDASNGKSYAYSLILTLVSYSSTFDRHITGTSAKAKSRHAVTILPSFSLASYALLCKTHFSKALAGYGIADSPLWKSGKKPSAKRAPVFSLPEKSGSNGDVTGRQAGEGLSGDGIKELLRITRARGVSGRATSPPAVSSE